MTTACTCGHGYLAAQWHDDNCPGVDDVPYTTEDDRRRCYQLARDLGISEEPLLLDRLVAAVTEMRNESWRGGYGAGVLYVSLGEQAATAALERVRALVAEGREADEATAADDYECDSIIESKRYMAARIADALADRAARWRADQ